MRCQCSEQANWMASMTHSSCRYFGGTATDDEGTAVCKFENFDRLRRIHGPINCCDAHDWIPNSSSSCVIVIWKSVMNQSIQVGHVLGSA